MGKPPSVIIIARHGARLDAEDPLWAQSSPTPYDTPLSYGGWTQTRALGARIASLLHAREITMERDDTAAASAAGKRRGSDFDVGKSSPNTSGSTTPTMKRPKKKHKVVIHTSPFLRCVQSSVAISAGMAQYEGNLARFESSGGSEGASGASTPPGLFTGPKRSQTLDSKTLEAKFASAKTETSKAPTSNIPPQEPIFRKNTLRVDGFLGEWLSPDYFELIAAPPSSNMMVAGAKADLLRAATPIRGLQSTPQNGQSATPTTSGTDSTTKSNAGRGFSMEELRESLSNDSNPEDLDYKDKTHHRLRKGSMTHGYTPPTPSYALKASEPIPPGYVADARDTCVNIDFQWDSMREPQNWGDGGQHGEEWSSMHKRFRRGISSMIAWYKEQGPYYDPQDSKQKEGARREADSDEETVIIIVTHGAGCNALLGALTNQPVLMDIGMGSLTMAVRKADRPKFPSFSSFSASNSTYQPADSSSTAGKDRRSSSSTSSHSPIRRRSSLSTTLAETYEMRLVASTEHLRAGADPLQIPQLRSPTLMPSIPELSNSIGGGGGGANSFGSLGSSGTSTPTSDVDRPLTRTGKNSALGSMRRRGTGGSNYGYGGPSGSPLASSPALPPQSRGPTSSANSSGLWGTSAASHSSFGLSSGMKAAHSGLGPTSAGQIRSLSQPDDLDGDGFMLNFQSEVSNTRPRAATSGVPGSDVSQPKEGSAGRIDAVQRQSSNGNSDTTPMAEADQPGQGEIVQKDTQKGLWGAVSKAPTLDTGNVASTGLSNRRRATLLSGDK